MYRLMGDFRIDGMAMRYSVFVPRLYNWCLELGFRPEFMMPSRAFCSDENQGYPIILLAKHFGVFPFNHGQVGGVVATQRHGAYAHHGTDLVMVQASHVGYDPESGEFGVYRRMRTETHQHSGDCGKICGVISWYQSEYRRAQQDVRVGRVDGRPVVVIDNLDLDSRRTEGLFLRLDRLIADDGSDGPKPVRVFSIAKAFTASSYLQQRLGTEAFTDDLRPIGDGLTPDLFDFRRIITETVEGQDHLEDNLAPVMRSIVTAHWPALDAARYNTQVEFDRTFRTIQTEPEFTGKNLLFIAGLNIDISPSGSLPFPLTKFAPWAACIRKSDGTVQVMEQTELVETLRRQPLDNPHGMELDHEIHAMSEADEVRLPPVK